MSELWRDRWWIVFVISMLVAVHVSLGCSHVPIIPTTCQPGWQEQDPEHRVIGVADCFKCLAAAPGTYDDSGRYRCLDYTCNECEKPVVNFGERPIKHETDGGAR